MLNYTFPSGLTANGMLNLASGINLQHDEILFKDVKLPELPPRDIDTILRLAGAGHSAEISVLEWITLLNGKEKWDFEHESREQTSNDLIWQIACRNHGLRYLIYWRFVMHLDGQEKSFPKGLIRQFKHHQRLLVNADKQRTSLVQSIYSSDTSLLCKLALSLQLPPSEVLKKVGLPGHVSFSKKAIKDIPSYLIHHLSEIGVDKIISFTLRLKTDEQDTLFSSILLTIPISKIEEHERLVSWIVKVYGPHQTNSRFNNLEEAAQRVVRDLIGILSFTEFSKLITKLTETEVAKKLDLDDRDIRQLNSRVSFWSNYQSRFLGFSVFLPRSTYQLLRQLNFQMDNMLLHQMDEASSEICILEFADFIILEFLRGSSSGLRIIDKKRVDLNSLKHGNIFTKQNQFESIPYLAEHDHLIYWQNSCEQLLRTSFNLTPPKEIKRFLITQKDKNGNAFHQDYSISIGLPKLSNIQFLEREDAIKRTLKNSTAQISNINGFNRGNFEIIRKVCILLNSRRTNELWFGYSQKYGWLIETGKSQNGLVLKCLVSSLNISIKVSNYEMGSNLYIKAEDYLNEFKNVNELNSGIDNLISAIERMPHSDLKESLEIIIKKNKTQ